MLEVAHGVQPLPQAWQASGSQREASGLTSGSVLHMTPSKSMTNTSDGTAATAMLPDLLPPPPALHGLPRNRCLESCGNRVAWQGIEADAKCLINASGNPAFMLMASKGRPVRTQAIRPTHLLMPVTSVPLDAF